MKLPLTPMQLALIVLAAACSGGSTGPAIHTSPPASGLSKINHIIIVMMENHSFDNYLGALAYAPGSPYHVTSGGCSEQDHGCVDGLSCRMDSASGLTCTNSNQENDGTPVVAFHTISRCVADLAHDWPQVHQEANFNAPNAALQSSPGDGFVRVNDAMNLDNGIETPTDDQTMGFYTQDDLPFYYDLAQKFAIDDRYFSSVLGPSLPNRLYLMAATSFGHVTNLHGPYPENCASFDQLGIRVPFLVVSPFTKPHYVSHTIADHTSLLAFIEARFLGDVASGTGTESQHFLTARDQYANTLMDIFDFDNAPSIDTSVSQAGLPANDCTPAL
jgi:phospholipase C